MTRGGAATGQGVSGGQGGGPSPWVAFVSVLLATVCAAMESTSISVTLPAMSTEFGVTPRQIIWVLGAPQIMVVAMLLPLSALGDALGYRRVYLSAVAGFMVTSLACSLAPSFGFLVAARLAQAVCVAGIMSVNFSIVRTLFSDQDLGKAIGLLAATVAAASSGGPAIAGLLLTFADWRWIFGLMVVFGVAALWTGTLRLPHIKGSGRALDWIGTGLTALMLASIVTGLYAVTYGWATPIIVVLLSVGLAAALALGRVSRGQDAPTFPFDLLRRKLFALSLGASVCAFTVQGVAFVILPFLLLFYFSLGELPMALVLSVWPLTIVLIAPWIGRLSDRIPAGPFGAAGLVLLAIGLVLLATAPAQASPLDLGWRMVLCGLGFGAFQTPNNRMLMLTAPKARSGAASGMLALARQMGRAVGTAIAAATLALGDFADARLALELAAGIAVISAILSFARHRLRPE